MGWRARCCAWVVVLVGCGPSSADPAGETTGTSLTETSSTTVHELTSGDASSTASPDATTTRSESDDSLSSEGTPPDVPSCEPAGCDLWIPQCFDGADNDNDGFLDLLDPECTTICDDDEGSFRAPTIDLFGGGCKPDCHFDGNTGHGDDGCLHDLKCDPENPGEDFFCPFTESPGCEKIPPPSDECRAFCEPYVPPGCDCFGCCEIVTPDGPITVFLEAEHDCRMDNLEACTTTCTSRIDECGNTCDECEICIGQTELDPACRTNVCDFAPTCTSHDDCACGESCQLGCCRPPPA